MDFGYAIIPFVAWFIAGTSKFAINSIKARSLAFGQIGYGGLPSTHSAIVSSVAALIAMKHGIADPAFGVAVGVAFIVVLDANNLRRQIGRHAGALNRLDKTGKSYRERMGHSWLEIGAGVVTGIFAAWLVNWVLG